jgi:hypothetical protein
LAVIRGVWFTYGVMPDALPQKESFELFKLSFILRSQPYSVNHARIASIHG